MRPSSLAFALVAVWALACGARPADEAARSDPLPPPLPPAVQATAETSPDAPALPQALRVRFLGVGGFLLERGSDAVLTAPLYTRPSFTTVLGGAARSDASAVAAHLPAAELARVRAILVGHAHYDHLLDVPAVQALAPSPTVYGNRSMAHLLAALAPDKVARCGGAPPSPVLPRSRVIALDDPAASKVDYRLCPAQRPNGASLDGAWVSVPGARVRVRALCSSHPAQFLGVHYGEGSVDADACTLPDRPADWLEGQTLAYLVDFLGTDGRPELRVYYQDAPTDAPIGHVPKELLAEKEVDLALPCIGSYASVKDEPTALLAAMHPRFAIGHHWEDFFVGPDEAPKPQPFLDTSVWRDRATAALPGVASGLIAGGAPATARVHVPMPGARFVLLR